MTETTETETETDPERSRVIYVTADSSQWMAVDVPFGLITPPTLTFHRPLSGPVEFFYAQCYGLPVPAEAGSAADLGPET